MLSSSNILILSYISYNVYITNAEVDPWSYLSVVLPTTLSDMAIAHIAYDGNSTSDAQIDEKVTTDSQSPTPDSTNAIILTGGCSSPNGNQFIENGEDEYFTCTELSRKAYVFRPIPPKTQFQAWTGDFKTLKDMPRERARHVSFQVWDGKVCVIGGRDAMDKLVSEIDCYDQITDYWTTIGKLPEEYQTSDCGGFALGNSIYLIGGYGATYDAIDQVTIIDVSNLYDIKFHRGPSMGTKRGDIDVAVLDDSIIYVSGGFTHSHDFSKPLNTVEQLVIGTETWLPVESLNEERGGKELVTLKGKVYALGGEQRVDVSGITKEELSDLIQKGEVVGTVEMLDPKKDVHGGRTEWKTIGEMPASLVRFGASEWEYGKDGVIFVFGGQSGYDSDCECFRNTEKVIVFDTSKIFKADERNAADATFAADCFVPSFFLAVCIGLRMAK